MKTIRMLVTGSRWLDDAPLVYRELAREWRRFADPEGDLPPLTVVHGGCTPRRDGTPGADQLADQWARAQAAAGLPVRVEVHEADWATHGRAAGPLRNAAMVATGADVVVGFPAGDSRGTRDCLRRAAAAGITVVVHEAVTA